MAADDALDAALSQFKQEQDDQTTIKATSSMHQAITQNPEEMARYNAIARKTGFDPLVIATDPRVKAEAERRAQMVDVNIPGLVQTHPKTASALTDANLAALAHDDVPAMQALEDLYGAFRSGGVMENFQAKATPLIDLRGAPVSEETFAQVKQAYDLATPEERRVMASQPAAFGFVARAVERGYARADEMARDLPTLAGFGDSRREAVVSRLIGEGALPQTAESMAAQGGGVQPMAGIEESKMDWNLRGDAPKANATGLDDLQSVFLTTRRGVVRGGLTLGRQASAVHELLGRAVGAEDYAEASRRRFEEMQRGEQMLGEQRGAGYLKKQFESALASTVSTAPGLLVGVATGGQAVPLTMMGSQVAAEETVNGMLRGLTTEEALARGAAYGVAEAIGEKFGLSKEIKALRNAAAGASTKELIPLFASAMAREVPGELLTTTLQYETDVAFGMEKPSLEKYMQNMQDTLVQTIMQSGVTTGTGLAISEAVRVLDPGAAAMQDAAARERNRAAEEFLKAGKDNAAITKISQTAVATKLRERDPARFKEFMQSMVEDSDLKEVFIDGAALQDTLAQSPAEVQQKFAQDMPDVMAQIEEAVSTGGTVRMPIEDYATHIAGTEIDAAILPSLKTDVAGLTYAEVQEQVKTQTAEMTDEAARILAEKEQDKEFQADAAKVYDTLLQRVEGAKRFSPDANKKYAALQQAYFITRAKKLGIKPSELLARFNVQVQAERTGAAAEMEQRPQTETPEFKAWFGDSKIVDAEGKPLVVYRGDRAGKTDFAEQKKGLRLPGNVFFTSSEAIGARYAKGGELYKTYLSLQNPYEVDAQWNGWDEVPAPREIKEAWGNPDKTIQIDELAVWARKKGYDGLVVHNVIDQWGAGDQFVALEPTQIKSATGNIGTFDPNDPNILRQTSSNYGYRARERARVATLDDFAPAKIGNLLRKTNWAILTAENPNAQQLSPEENAQRNADLKADLDALGVQYADHEKGVAVAGITRAQALDLGAKYGQETVLTPEGLLHQDGTTEPALSMEAFAPRQVVGEDRVGSVDAAAVYFAPQPKEILPAGRVEFYVDEGKGVRPRLGSGVFRHELTLANIYDGAKNPLGFPAESEAFEAAVAKAGFDGYVKSQDGQGVGVFFSADDVQIDIPPPILGAMERASMLYQALNEVAETLPPTGKLEQQDLTDLRKLWAIYAQSETTAQYGTAQVKAFADDAPGLQRSLTDTLDAVMRGMADTSVKNITHWHEGTQRLPSGGFAYEIVSGNSSAAVYLDMADRSIQIDIMRWGEGRGGSGVYKAVLDFARANGFVFHGDAQGISVAGIKRRLENLLSHALQSGDTSYMRLHPKQIEFIEQETGLKIEWTNDSKNNVEQMLNASYNLANLDIPELKNVYFDFIQKQFVARDTGAPADLAGLVAKARRNADAVRREGAPGMATVKRTVLANTLLSAQGENRRRVFADMARLSLEPVPGTGRLLYQSEAGGKLAPVADLFVAHNLSVENLRHAIELGGLAAPSLAIARVGKGAFESFGEITLLADKSILESPKARTFEADVYTPRHPQATYTINRDAFKALVHKLETETAEAGNLDMPSMDDVEQRGPEHMLLNPAMKYYFLKSKGKAPKAKKLKAEPWVKKAEELGIRDSYSLETSPEFERIVRSDLEDQRAKIKADPELKEIAEELSDWFNADGTVDKRVLREKAWQAIRHIENKGIDISAMRADIDKAFRSKKLTEEYQAYVTDRFNSIKTGAKIFKGFTPSGTRRYAEYNLENVVKEMTQAIRAGEGFNYGAGTIRAKYTRELKTIKQIQARRGQIIGKDFEKVKEESQDKLSEALDALRPYYKYDASSFGYFDDASSALGEGPKGWSEAFELDEESRRIINELIEYLRALPTEYFETKIGRAVSLSEFSTAVVPSDTPSDVLGSLKAAGVTIKKYKRGDATDRGNVVAQQQNLLFQKNRGTFNPDTLTISLLKDADLTTFLHETGHFFLETESALASDPNAPQEIRDDFQKTLDWFGIPDLATWNAMSFEQKRPYHERFARGFEAYLLEGRAPSNELRSIFASFKAWLLHVYRTVTNLNVELTDEVRGVFDRMLASEEEIAAVQARAGMTAAMIEAADEEAKKAYVALDTGAGDDATDELQRRSLRDMKWLSNAKSDAMKKLQREAASKRKEVRAEVTAEVEAEPINQARAFLRKGITVDPTTGDSIQATEGFRMNREIVAQMYPETMLARPDLSKLRGMTEKDGLHPDLVADMFGFRSGDALIRELIDGENPRDKITGLTDQRMLERYGDLVDENAIEAAANEAVHNDARARFMATGLKMLSKSKLPVSQIQKAAADAANATIAAKRVRDLHPAKYIAAETKANREVLKTAAKDVKAAQRAQRAALLNNRLAKAAQEAQEEVRKGVDRLNRTQKAAAQANMRGEYLIQLNELLARFDLRKSTTLKELDAKRTPLADWLTDESERLSAVVPDIPAWILNESNRRSYKELTIEEFRGLVDAVKQLEMMARREEEQYQAIRGMKFREERKAILDRIREFHPEAFSLDGEPLGMSPKFVKHLGDKVEEIGEKFMGEFLNAETLVNLLEGGNFGQVHESLLGRMSKRADWKATRMGDIYRKMAPLFGQYSVKERYDFARADIGAPIGMSLTRENALVVALLHGNTEGRERLANYGWSQKQQQDIINLLDERDMRLAEGIWDLFDNDLWPELKALNERTRGKAPPKVVAIEVEHKGKTYRGGYFRLKYDTNLDERAYRLDEGAAVKELLGGGLGMSAKTGQGASTERKQNVTMRPRLDLGVFAEAVSETVHDIAYREAVADTMRLLNDVRVQNTIKTAAGVPTYRALVTRVREIAAPPRNPAGFVEKTLSIARKNTIITLMSGVNTALQNFTGFVSAVARVNPGRLAREIALFYSPQMSERYNFAIEHSEYMRNRHNAFERDLQNEIKKMTVNANIMPDTGAWLTLMSIVDKGTSVPVWNAAFAEGMKKFENDNTKAVDYADHVVRQSQGSGRELDVAQIMSGHGGYGQLKRIFTMFYSYFNAQLGMLVRSGVISAKEAKTNPAMATARFTKDFMLIVILPAVLTKMIFKGGGDDEDPEEWLHIYGHAIAMYGMAMIPLVRDIGSFAWASFDHDVKNYGYKITPVQAAGEGVVKGAVAARDIAVGEGDDRDLKNLIMGTSYAVGLPGKLISDTTMGTKAFLEGEAPPTAVVFGPPKK